MSDRVVLDVGGCYFVTSRLTLENEDGNFFKDLLHRDEETGSESEPDRVPFVDRDPLSFSYVLN